MKYIVDVDNAPNNKYIFFFSVKENDLYHQVTTEDGEFYQGQIYQDIISIDFDQGPDTGYSKSFVDIWEKFIFDDYDKAFSFLVKLIKKKFDQNEIRNSTSILLEK